MNELKKTINFYIAIFSLHIMRYLHTCTHTIIYESLCEVFYSTISTVISYESLKCITMKFT